MLCFPPAKINLGLTVLKKSSDGYHFIESLLIPIALFDILEIGPGKHDKLHLSGFPLDCSTENNLVWKALLLMRKYYSFPPVEMHLHKQIPSGAGLGGGSSDAAKTLLVLKQLFNLDLNKNRLLELASELGSDCPFFLEPKAQYAKGRGELLEPFSLNMLQKKLLLIIPDFSVSTHTAYSKVEVNQPQILPRQVLEMPIKKWKSLLKNDFEKIIFDEFPLLGDVKETFYHKGAIYASLSGSGSALYALFSEKTEIELPDNYKFYWMDFPA